MSTFDPENSDCENLIYAIGELSFQLGRLGNNDADTGMGAIEMLAKEIRDGSGDIAMAIRELADAISDLNFK